MDKNYIFLLGGKDLEMQRIKELLIKEGYKESINLFNKQLNWGAKLSSYKDELEKFKDKTIYGIELIEDITPPCNYKAIDHHNEKSDNKSSLMQVLELLNIEPTREDELISANDIGHIEQMKKIGATKEEIADIRARDRKAQGVTEADEEKAKKEIKNLKNINGVWVLKTSLDKFSPIVDRIEQRPLLIYSENNLTYYGDITKLKDEYKKEIKYKNAYYGRKYFGFDSKYISGVGVDNLVKNILEIYSEIISYHTFMFPFIFEKEHISKDIWGEAKSFEVKNTRDFNEKNYFYKYVQKALLEDSKISRYYDCINSNGTYTISYENEKEHQLYIDGISLRVFNTNIAILSFNLANCNYEKFEDILMINDYGRRVYPQYLGKEFTKDTKKSFLADKITIKLENNQEIEEDFSHYDKNENLQNIKLASFINHFIGSFENIEHIIDDRMFVISQYNNDALIEKMKIFSDNQYHYEESDEWYKYIFIDGNDKTCQSKHMTKELIKEATYDRWVELGTLFGITRYSFVALTGSWFGKNRLLPHMQTMYFQMFTLLLAYRATIIKFSDTIQDITKKEDKEIFKESKKLYKKYLDFVNKLYFQEITAQEQGIEIYDKAIKNMKIDRYLNGLDREINELHTYMDMIEEKRRNNRLEKISMLGAVFLPPSLIAGIYGMNVFDFYQSSGSMVIVFIAMILSSIIGYVGVKNRANKYLAIFLFVAVVFTSFYIIGDSKNSILNKVETILKEKK